jgi:N-acetylglucosaminyldiphosphoundecaprenol N-acetyl-beta-D-mannosaminyltransferase
MGFDKHRNSHDGAKVRTKRQIDRAWVWGLPLARLTMADALSQINELVASRRPSYLITANLHYAMLSHADPLLQKVNDGAAFILADGQPLVWVSRWLRNPLPERVAGADLLWRLAENAAERGQRLFMLGGAPGVADETARRLCQRYPGLQIAGTACPAVDERPASEQAALLERIRSTAPDIMLVALGQPKGELWIAANYEKLLIPVCVQIGASFDFVVGRVRRAPRWLQRFGLEWAFRLCQEPRRLLGRYVRNLVFLLRMLITPDRRDRHSRDELASSK